MSLSQRWIVASCVCLVLAACHKAPPPAAMQALPVMVQPVKVEKVNDSTEFVATIQSLGSSVLQPQVEGQITKIFVRSGQHVAAGQKLMQIDPLKQEATVLSSVATQRSRQAQLQLAEQQLNRTKQLYAAGVVAKQELDTAQSAYEAARADVHALGASVNEQREQLRYFTITAPTAGIVGDIPVRVGDHVASTTVLTTVDTGKGLEAYISIPADRASDVKLGTPVQLISDDGTKIDTKVTFISPRVDTANQLLLLKAAVPSAVDHFRNQQVVHARVVWKQIDAPVVPVLDVTRQSSQLFAFVVGKKGDQPIAEQRTLQTGELIDNKYVVKSGLAPGDQLIVSGLQMLADGMPVKPMPAPPAGAPGAAPASSPAKSGSAKGE